MNVSSRSSPYPRVYIAGPYRAPTMAECEVNIKVARYNALRVVQFGGIPITPHLLFGLFDWDIPDSPLVSWGHDGHRFWLDALLDLVLHCDCLYVFDSTRKSAGTEAEVEFAKLHNIPVFYNESDLINFLKEGKSNGKSEQTKE